MATVKKLSETVYEVSVTRNGEELKHLKEHVLVHFKDAKVDGFRKGHVPADVLEKKFKKEIEGEILNHIISEEYRKAVEENNLSPIADIKLEKYENNEDNVEVVFTIPVLPEINLGDYKSVKVEKEALDVNDEKVNAEIEIMRSNAGKLKEVADDEAAKDKDVTNINFEGFIDGEAFDGGKAEGFDLTLGSKSFIDTFEDQIIGHKKGDEFDVNVTFPEEYHAENLKGKPAVFKVKVNSIKRKEEAELNEVMNNSEMIIGSLSYKLFIPMISIDLDKEGVEDKEILYLSRKTRINNLQIEAKCKQTNEGFVVLKGSMISLEDLKTMPKLIKELRVQLINSGIIKDGILKENQLFTSASYAAAFVLGTNANGLTHWKTKNGQTLKELEDN